MSDGSLTISLWTGFTDSAKIGGGLLRALRSPFVLDEELPAGLDNSLGVVFQRKKALAWMMLSQAPYVDKCRATNLPLTSSTEGLSDLMSAQMARIHGGAIIFQAFSLF